MFEESALIFSEFRGIRGIWNLKKITYFIFEFSLSDFECLTISLPNCDQNVKIQQNLQISFCKMLTKNSIIWNNYWRGPFIWMATLYGFAYRLKTEINPPFDILSLGHYIGEEVLKSFSSKLSFTHMHTGYLRRSLRQFHLIW